MRSPSFPTLLYFVFSVGGLTSPPRRLSSLRLPFESRLRFRESLICSKRFLLVLLSASLCFSTFVIITSGGGYNRKSRFYCEEMIIRVFLDSLLYFSWVFLMVGILDCEVVSVLSIFILMLGCWPPILPWLILLPN